MEIIVPDQIIMGLILYAGDAKQHIYKALDYIWNCILYIIFVVVWCSWAIGSKWSSDSSAFI